MWLQYRKGKNENNPHLSMIICQSFKGVVTPGFNVFLLSLNTVRISRTHQEDSGMTGRKGGQENRVWWEINVYSVRVQRWDDYSYRWREVREEGGLVGGLNVITRTAGGSKGWREKEMGQIWMAQRMKKDRDRRIWETVRQAETKVNDN